MRTSVQSDGPLRARAIAGTHVILMAIDVDASARKGLKGFAIKRKVKGSNQPAEWLRGIKYFDTTASDVTADQDFSSRDQPFQSFLWSDYECDVGTTYEFTIVALYGKPDDLQEKYSVTLRATTEPEEGQDHAIWFNRGAIASRARAQQFHNARMTPAKANDVAEDGQMNDAQARWLSRGLVEACLRFINRTKKGEGLRVCAYEFTYEPVLLALKRALKRGVDVRIVYHWTKKETDPNAKAIKAAGLTKTSGGKQVLFQRTRTSIPHNKFIVKMKGKKPVAVWTGSTNFTDSGFLGQTNVGHLVFDEGTAGEYLALWEILKEDPVHSEAVSSVVDASPNPPNAIPKKSIATFFSPRIADNMLDWYGQRLGDAGSLSLMTIPFNVAPTILKGLTNTHESMRLVVLEDPPDETVRRAEKANRGKLVFSNGGILGQTFIKYKAGGAKVTPITQTPLEDWFVKEELARPINNGHVFFIHSKVMVIDPLSDDPLVCTGSANFSTNSLVANDENMLLIRGNTRVADIYLTEFDRIFRHFFARNGINAIAAHGDGSNPRLLDPTDGWIKQNYNPKSYKDRRRRLFFPDAPPSSWAVAAKDDDDPFADEDDRAQAAKNKRSAVKKASKTT